MSSLLRTIVRVSKSHIIRSKNYTVRHGNVHRLSIYGIPKSLKPYDVYFYRRRDNVCGAYINDSIVLPLKLVFLWCVRLYFLLYGAF